MTSIAIVNASIGHHDGQIVLIADGFITGVSAGRVRPRAATTIDAKGGAVLPGLWDHHVHLQSSAARKRSVDVSRVENVRDFAGILSRAAHKAVPGQWMRVVGYNDSKLGELTAQRLQDLIPTDTPMRIQHRGGHQWVLNLAGVRLLAAAAGRPIPADGILWEDDTLFRLLAGPRTSASDILGEVQHLTQQGCIGATDMTATTDNESAGTLRSAAGDSIDLQLFGSPGPGGSLESNSVRLDGVKIVISDHDLPPPESLRERIMSSRPLPVAMHAVTAHALALAAWAFNGEVVDGDRIEHGFLASDGLIEEMARCGLSIGAHPGFIWSQGDRLLQHLEQDELPDYQKLRTWQRAGARLLGGTDLPFATANLWRAMQSAVDRRTSAGNNLNVEEALTPEEAFTMFTKDGLRGEAKLPRLKPGDVADLCVLDVPWRQARKDLAAVRVSATIRSGITRWRSPERG